MIQVLDINSYSSNNVDSYSTINNIIPIQNIIHIQDIIRNNYINQLFNSENFKFIINKANEFVSLILQFIFNFYNHFNNHSYKLLEPFTNALDNMNSNMYYTFGSFDEKYMYSSSLFIINLLCFFIIIFALLFITDKIYDKIQLLTNEIETHNKLRFRMKEQFDSIKYHINEIYRIQNYIIIQQNKLQNKKNKQNQKNNQNEKNIIDNQIDIDIIDIQSNLNFQKKEYNETNKNKDIKNKKEKNTTDQNKDNDKNSQMESTSNAYANYMENNQEKFGNGRYSKRERKSKL